MDTFFIINDEMKIWRKNITETSPYKSNPRFAPNI